MEQRRRTLTRRTLTRSTLMRRTLTRRTLRRRTLRRRTLRRRTLRRRTLTRRTLRRRTLRRCTLRRLKCLSAVYTLLFNTAVQVSGLQFSRYVLLICSFSNGPYNCLRSDEVGSLRIVAQALVIMKSSTNESRYFITIISLRFNYRALYWTLRNRRLCFGVPYKGTSKVDSPLRLLFR